MDPVAKPLDEPHGPRPYAVAGREGSHANKPLEEGIRHDRKGRAYSRPIALKNRRAFLARAAAGKVNMLDCHWAYPGVGYGERKGGAYRFAAA
jgi:hypothetical protein